MGILPTGHIYAKEKRPVRDLLRKRCQLVQQCTAHILSIQNLYARIAGLQINSNAIKKLTQTQVEQTFADLNLSLAINSNRHIMQVLNEQIKSIEKAVFDQVKLDPKYHYLTSIQGIGRILALTIMLETGNIN